MFSRLTKNHISIEESCNLSSNSTLCLNKISISTMLEEVEEAFIHQDTPLRNLKRCNKADGSPTTLTTFSLVNSSDRAGLLKSGLVINIRERL